MFLDVLLYVAYRATPVIMNFSDLERNWPWHLGNISPFSGSNLKTGYLVNLSFCEHADIL